MQMPITLLFAGAFGLFALLLSFLAGFYRGASGIPILYGEPTDKELALRVRRQQNFLEYVPMVLILMGAIELNGGSTSFLFIAGTLLIAARIAHAIGIRHDNVNHVGRVTGAAGTALVTLVTALYALWLAIPALLT